MKSAFAMNSRIETIHNIRPKKLRFNKHLFTQAFVCIFCFFCLPASEAFGVRGPAPCVDLPPIPANTMFTLTGAFEAHLVCPNSYEDIALKADGDMGVLFCEPNSPDNYDLQAVNIPDCHPLKLPNMISMHIELGYLYNTCEDSQLNAAKEKVKSIIERTIMGRNDSCGLGQKVCNFGLLGHVMCGDNLNYRDSPKPKHFEMNFYIETEFSHEKGLGFYSGTVDTIRSQLHFVVESDRPTEIGEATAQSTKLLAVEDADMIYGFISSWKGNCDNHKGTSGTDLERHWGLTCRGCPHKYYLRENDDTCTPCPYGTFTEKPFSTSCTKCKKDIRFIPPKMRQAYIDKCF